MAGVKAFIYADISIFKMFVPYCTLCETMPPLPVPACMEQPYFLRFITYPPTGEIGRSALGPGNPPSIANFVKTRNFFGKVLYLGGQTFVFLETQILDNLRFPC